MPVAAPAVATRSAPTLGQSVGKGGVNRPADVGLVQQRLADHILRHQGLRSAFAAEADGLGFEAQGRCCARTILAIRLFQRVVLRWSDVMADGRVDPGRATWAGLNGNRGDGLLTAPHPPVRVLGPAAQGGQPATAAPAAKPANPPQSQSGPGYFGQSDKAHGATLIGNSTDKTISGYGCLLCSLTMAATWIGAQTKVWDTAGHGTLLPAALTPLIAQDILRASGAFTGASLNAVTAAAALGMDAKDTGIGVALAADSATTVTTHLSAGRRAIAANVDYKGTSGGDHWVLFYHGPGGDIMCYDPADRARSQKSGRISTDRAAYDTYRGKSANTTAILFGESGKRHFGVVRLLYLWPAGEA